MLQHSLKLCICLHPVDVGAANSRPYAFYRLLCAFCNALFSKLIQGARPLLRQSMYHDCHTAGRG